MLPRRDEVEKPVRRSNRKNAGQHSNPHNVPKSIIQQQSSDVFIQPKVDPEVLANISRTQLLLAQMLSNIAQ